MVPDVLPPPPGIVPMRELQRRYLVRVYERCGKDKRRTALALGLSLKTVYLQLERAGVYIPMDQRPRNGGTP